MSPAAVDARVRAALSWLEGHASRAPLAGMARYGVSSDTAFGVSMANIQVLGRQLGRDHALAEALWKTGRYEARLLTAFVDEPERVTVAQMDRWCREFDNWAVVDTLCFHLFDRAPHAWSRIDPWSRKKEEFPRRAAFALLWALALHDRAAGDAPFRKGLRRIEAAADDDRNFVKKAIHMALGAIGRRNATLHAAAVSTARRLAESPDAASRWVGRSSLRELESPRVAGRFDGRRPAARAKTKR